MAAKDFARGCLLSIAYCAAFLVLRRWSVDQWYLPAGLRLVTLLLMPWRKWPYLLAGDIVAVLALRVPMVETRGYSAAWAYVSALFFMPIVSVLPLVARSHIPNLTHKDHWLIALALIMAMWGSCCSLWGRAQGTGHPGITMFNRGGGPITFDPLNRLDRQMNAHLFLFGPTGSGKSATLNNLLNQVTALYRPRLFIAEAGNSFGLFSEFARRLGLTVNRVKLAPGSGVTLAPFADARRLIETPSDMQTLDADALDEDLPPDASTIEADEQRDVLGELEITARLMITGGEDKEEARMTRADRSLIRQCILDAAEYCVDEERTVLTRDVRNALRNRGQDPSLPEMRRVRLLEMADAMDMFCQGTDGEMFDRDGTPWPEADITLVDLATYAREGYNAQLSIAYISLISTVNNIAERDQYPGPASERATCRRRSC